MWQMKLLHGGIKAISCKLSSGKNDDVGTLSFSFSSSFLF
ncbi:hypothetical protein HMPREF0971_00812 [Segatella oris F0302]|uniref:Uncharacterized protein n=1 Tax=Segatella oris F0302 TaxID=649760 RepID=D1QPC2_9BACT|nr:hypothetical protein HMPREF0971_00812 [Segatella oris F0302]